MTHVFTDEKLYEVFASNLARYGYPMMHETENAPELPIEECIIRILKEYPHPRFLLGLPVILYKNKIDTRKLYSLAIELSEVNSISWILEETEGVFDRCKGIKKENIEQLIRLLDPLKTSEETRLSTERTNCFVEYARERQTPAAKKYGILSGFTHEDFDSEFTRRCRDVEKA